MHRSVFGESIQSNRKFSRREAPLLERMDFGLDRLLTIINKTPVSILGSLDNVVEAVDRVGKMLNTMVADPIAGAFFFQRNPKREIPKMVEMLFDSRLTNESVQVVSPVCPDYVEGTYRLSDGVGETAIKALRFLPKLSELFNRYDFSLNMRIDVADVEAYDETVLRASGETTESFLYKVGQTIRSIEREPVVHQLGIEVVPMSDVVGSGYIESQREQARVIAKVSAGSMARVRDLLHKERIANGDFLGMDDVLARLLVCYELGGYAEYGRQIGGEAIIASPDAMSAIPAYHFAVSNPDDFSPVIYISR